MDALHLGVIFARMGVPRIEEAVDESAFVGEEEEPFAVGIETADRVNARRETKLGKRAPLGAGLRRELRKNAVGFVESEEHALVR
jgi:hypothetical protein